MYYLSACAIVKGEARYIREWLLFHIAAGVEHFFIYDNGIADGTAEAITDVPFLSQRTTIIRWPALRSQFKAYEHCISHYGESSRWIAFLDADEFLFSINQENIRAELSNFEEFNAVGVSTCLYGSSGLMEATNDLITKTYKMRADFKTFNHQHCYGKDKNGNYLFWPTFPEIKSIVNPSRVESVLSPHSFSYRDSGFAVDEEMMPIDFYRETVFARRKEITVKKLRINHYWSKSVSDFQLKLNRTLADQYGRYDVEKAYLRESLMNAVADDSAFLLADKIANDLSVINDEYPIDSTLPPSYFFKEELPICASELKQVNQFGTEFVFHVADPEDSVQRSFCAGEFYEQEELSYLSQVLTGGPLGVCIDIGSNVGNHAVFFWRHHEVF